MLTWGQLYCQFLFFKHFDDALPTVINYMFDRDGPHGQVISGRWKIYSIWEAENIAEGNHEGLQGEQG